MTVEIMDNEKLVEIWLSNAEKADSELREYLAGLYRRYGEKKYTVAVYESGGGDLLQDTMALLRFNRCRTAQREVARAKAAGEDCT